MTNGERTLLHCWIFFMLVLELCTPITRLLVYTGTDGSLLISDFVLNIKIIFSGHFHPINIYYDNIKNSFQGDLTEVLAKIKTLLLILVMIVTPRILTIFGVHPFSAHELGQGRCGTQTRECMRSILDHCYSFNQQNQVNAG